MQIRYACKNEKEIAMKFWRENFDDNNEQINFYFNNIFSHKNFLILEENGIIKSSLHENPYILSWNFNKNIEIFKTKYIVGVSTDKGERYKGYMKNLIVEMLKNFKKTNLPFVFLNPINPILYRQYGFEYFSSLEKYKFKIDLLKEIEIIQKEDIQIKEINLNNYSNFLEELISIYNFSMQDKKLYLKRDFYYFKKLLLEIFTDNMKVLLMYKENKAVAYIFFGFNDNKIEIREFFSKNIESKKYLLSLLYSYRNKFEKISLISEINSNLEFIFKNQLQIEKSISHFMMLRIINPLILLEKYKDIFQGINIFIKDDILKENTAIYSFKENNKIKIFNKNLNYDLEINIGDLAQLLSGFLSFDDLVRLEKIKFKDLEENIHKEIFEKLSHFFTKKNSYLYEML